MRKNLVRTTRLFAAGMLASVALVATGGSPADALLSPCSAFLLDAAGVPGATPVSEVEFDVPLPNLGSSVTEVFAGGTYPVGGPSDPVVLPASTEHPTFGTLTITEVKNITLDITSTGQAALSAPTLSGGTVSSPQGTLVGGNTIHLVFPGSQGGSAFGATGDLFFPGGSTFTPPTVSATVTAGAAGTTISGELTGFTVDASLLLGATPLNVRLVCNVPDNTLGSVQVVDPPPPGAPNAVSDVATTPQGAAVVIPVLANDVKNPDVDIDPDSLAITSPPTSGTAVVEADGTVTYTPNAGFAGTDTFEYELCSMVTEEGAEPACDTAVVTVTVVAPVTPASTSAPTTTTTVAAAATTTTVATLPATGANSAPLAAAGVLAVAFGALALLVTSLVTERRR